MLKKFFLVALLGVMTSGAMAETEGSSGTTVPELPSGYTLLDYIENVSNAYILTDYKPNQSTQLEISFMAKSLGGSRLLIGCADGPNETDKLNVYDFQFHDSKIVADYGSEAANRYSCDMQPNIKYVATQNCGTFSLDGAVQHTSPDYTFSLERSLSIFNIKWRDVDNYNYSSNSAFIGRVYYVKIKENDEFILNMVPCRKEDGVFGLYDLIGKKFYGSSSNNQFIGRVADGASGSPEEDQVTGWILPRGTIDPWTAKYQYATETTFDSAGPAADAFGKAWYSKEYDDSNWETISGPIGNQDWCEANWNQDNSSYWLRINFTMKDINYDAKHVLSAIHDDGMKAYLNGHLIFNHNGVCSGDHNQEIESMYFLNGQNTLAVYINNVNGAAYVDFGITSTDVNFESESQVFNVDNMSFRTTGESEVKLLTIEDNWDTSIPQIVTYKEKQYSVTSFSNKELSNKENFIRLSFPSTVTNFKNCSLKKNTNLVRLSVLAPEPPVLTNDLFSDYTGKYLFVPDESVEAYKSADYWKCFSVLPYSQYNTIVLDGDIYIFDGIRFIVTSRQDHVVAVSNRGEDKSLNKTGDIVIPNEIDINSVTYKVTEILESAFHGWKIKTVIIPNNVQAIRQSAFGYCSSLTSVSFPTTLSVLEDFVFDGTALTSVTIPEGIESILSLVFGNCRQLESVTFPSSLKTIKSGAFVNCIKLDNIEFPNNFQAIEDAEWPGGAFEGCTSLKNITWGTGIQTIGYKAFANTGVSELDFPLNVTTISRGAFAGCKNLKSVKIPNSITQLAGAFSDCTSLTDVSLPSSLVELNSTFSGCSSLKQIDLKNVKRLYGSVFGNCKSLESITIPASVENLGFNYGANVFEGCSSLTEVTIPETVKSLWLVGMFRNCTNLKKIVINATNWARPAQAFYGCTNLETVVFPDNITLYENNANYVNESEESHMFERCSSLETIKIPEGWYHLSSSAFAYCSKLKNVTLPSTLLTIRSNCFSYCYALQTINIPPTVKSIGEKCFFGDESLTYVFFGKNTVLESIPDYCFQECASLPELELPEMVLRLGKGSFKGCVKLNGIVLPATLTSVGEECFYDCSALKTMTSLAVTPPDCGAQAFDNSLYNTQGTLYVPEESGNQYAEAYLWEDWSDIKYVGDKPLSIILDLDDTKPFVNIKNTNVSSFTYSRVFSNNKWQGIILPVSLDYSDWSENFDIARIYNITPNMEDESVVSLSVNVDKLKTGQSTVANVPYLIRAKVADSENAQSITKTNCTVYAATPVNIECSTTMETFKFYGTYTGVTGEDMYSNQYYALAGGVWCLPMDETVSLKPYRCYMDIEDKTTGYVTDKPSLIQIRVIGEEETDGIETINLDSNNNSITILRNTIGLAPGEYSINGKRIKVE